MTTGQRGLSLYHCVILTGIVAPVTCKYDIVEYCSFKSLVLFACSNTKPMLCHYCI